MAYSVTFTSGSSTIKVTIFGSNFCVSAEGKYPSLCEACANPACTMEDKYWGPTGTLQCLVDNAGDVMWGELDDVMFYFGVSSH